MIRRHGVVLGAVVLTLACVGRIPPGQLSDTDFGTATTDRQQDFPTRRIFRVRYQGPSGGAGFRLVARLTSPATYRLTASDPVGRSLWTLDYDAPTTRFIDHRAGRACTTDRPVALTEVALGTLSLGDLALVLVGRPPAAGTRSVDAGRPPAASEEEPASVTVQWADSRVESWTLWSEGRPVLWFRAESAGGILSHRDGSQFRWRETGREDMDDPPEPLEVPEEFSRVECVDLEPAPATGTSGGSGGTSG